MKRKNLMHVWGISLSQLVFFSVLCVLNIDRAETIFFPASTALVFAFTLSVLTYVLFRYLIFGDEEQTIKLDHGLGSIYSKYISNTKGLAVIVYVASLAAILLIPSIANDNRFSLPGYFIDWVRIPFLNWFRLLAAILLTTFLPGFVLLNIVRRGYSHSKLETLLFSFFLSAFFDIVAYCVGLFWVPNFSGSYIEKWTLLFYSIPLLAYLLTHHHRLRRSPRQRTNAHPISSLDEIGKKYPRRPIDQRTKAHPISSSHQIRKKSFYDFVILLCVVAFVLIGVIAIAVVPYPLHSGDQWTHCGQAVRFYKGEFDEVDSARLYWYSIFLASHFVLSGLPPVNAFLSLIFLGALPYLAFYLMTTAFFKPESKVPAVATVFTLFSGFGWVYTLYFRAVDPTAPLYNILTLATEASYDIYRPLFFPTVIHHWYIFGVPTSILLIYLYFKDNIPTTVRCTLISTLTVVGYLTHILEIIVFFLFFLFYSLIRFFWKDFRVQHQLTALSLILGMLLVIVVDFSAPYRWLTGDPGMMKILFYSVMLLPAPLLLGYLRKRKIVKNILNGLLFHIRSLIGYIDKRGGKILSAFLLVYLYSFSFITMYFSSEYLTVLDIYRTVGYFIVPWYFYPIKLGVVGSLSVICVIYLLFRKQGRTAFVPFIVLILTVIAISATSRQATYFFRTDETRFMAFLLFSASVLSGFAVTRVAAKAKSLWAKQHLRIPKMFTIRLVASCLLSLIIVVGVSSTLGHIQLYCQRPSSLTEPKRGDIEAVSFLMNNFEKNSSILVINEYNTQKLLALTGMTTENLAWGDRKALVYFQPERPEAPLYTLSTSRVRYIFMRTQDFQTVYRHRTFFQGFLANYLFDYLPIAFDNNDVVIYEVPPFSPPSSTGLSIPSAISSVFKFYFSENFDEYSDGETPRGWISVGDWYIEKGKYKSSTHYTSPDIDTPKDITLSFKLKVDSFGYKPYFCPIIEFGHQDEDHYYRLDIREKGPYLFYKTPEGLFDGGRKRVPIAEGLWHEFKVSKSGGLIEVCIDDGLALSAMLDVDYQGSIRFSTPECLAYLDDVEIKSRERYYDYWLPLYTVAMSGFEYSLYLENDTALFNSSSMLLPFDICEDERYEEYLKWVRSGGRLIVLNTQGERGFAELLSIESSNETEVFNGLKSKSRHVSIPSTISYKYYSSNESTEILSYFASDNIPVSPYAFRRRFGDGEIIYLIIEPYLSALETESDSRLRREKFKQLGSFLNVLDLPFLQKYVPSHDIEFLDFGRGQTELLGCVQIETNSILLNKMVLSTLDFSNSSLEGISENNKFFGDSILESLKLSGLVKIVIENSNVQISAGFGSYAQLSFQDDTSCSVIISPPASASFIFTNDMNHYNFTVYEGTVKLTMNTNDLIFRQPKISVSGTTAFQQLVWFYEMEPRPWTMYNLVPLQIDGTTSFEVEHSDGEITVLSAFRFNGNAIRHKLCAYPLSGAEERRYWDAITGPEVPWFKILTSMQNLSFLTILAILCISYFVCERKTDKIRLVPSAGK